VEANVLRFLSARSTLFSVRKAVFIRVSSRVFDYVCYILVIMQYVLDGVLISVSFAFSVPRYVCNRFSRFIWMTGAIKYYNRSLYRFPIY
jgi:uncharacterized Tic20 family protein